MRPPCVLVAEDDDDIRAMIAAALRRDGYAVIEAVDGADLLDRVGSALMSRDTNPPPDIIVTDVRMPGFTGLQVLAGLRDSNWEVPILLISAYGSEHMREEAERLGASRFFHKPFDVDDLRSAVLDLVPNHAWLRYAARPGPADRN